jgi:hypothetical protein
MANWYCGSTKWSAVSAWAASTAYSVGNLRRQLAAPTVGNERVWRCTTAGTSGGSEPSWTLTQGSTTNDGSAVWTEVTGQETYGWDAAHARITNALAWMAAGDTCWVSGASAETRTTNATFTSPGTAAAPCRIICVDDTSGTPPTVEASTATYSTTGSTGISFAGFAHVKGITFNNGTGAGSGQMNFTNSNPTYYKFDTCALKIVCTSTASRINAGPGSFEDDNLLELVNTAISFGNASQSFLVRCPIIWHGGSVDSGVPPTILFRAGNQGAQPYVTVSGVDLSAMGSGTSLVDADIGNPGLYQFQGCKLGSSVALTTGTYVGPGGITAELINSAASDIGYRYEKANYQGTVSTETTIVLTGGATNLGTAFSHKFVSSANSTFDAPLAGPWMSFKNSTTGSGITVSAEVITDGVTLKDGEAWIEVDYLGVSGFPQLVRITDRCGLLSVPGSNQGSSSATWTTTGLSSPVTQVLSATFTPQEQGIVRARVMLAKASTTMYVNPEIRP